MKHFYLVKDILNLESDQELEILPGYVLKRAQGKVLEKSREFVVNHLSGTMFEYHNLFENEREKGAKGEDKWKKIESKQDWKYTVIEYEKEGKRPNDLIECLIQVSDLDLTAILNGHLEAKSFGYGHNLMISLHALFDLSRTPRTLRKSDVVDFQTLYYSFQKLKAPDHTYISKALTDFIMVGTIPKSTPFRILAYFAILEFLLTSYNNRSFDSSISHQLKKKVSLVDNLHSKPIDFNSYFKGPDTNTLETIIEKLYKYRNDIAHGNMSDFEKDLKLLKNKEHETERFLRMIVKRVLKASIHQPDLILDLKEV